jgi:capsular exopolysaccharide synthesis family protein
MLDRYQYSPRAAAVSAPPPSLGLPPEEARDIDFGRLWATLVRRKMLMLAVGLGFIGAVLVFTLLQHKQYTTEVKLIATDSSGSTQSSSGDSSALPILSALLASSGGKSPETYAELLQQSPVAQDVITKLNLHASVASLQSHVIVRPVTDTSILTLRVAWSDPATSAQIANTYAGVFVDRERHLVSQQAETAIGFLDQQLPEAQQRMQATQAALAAYQVRSGIADLPAQTKSDIDTLAALEAKQQQAQLEADQAEAQLGVVRGQLGATPATIIGQQSVAANPVHAALAQQVATLSGQLDAARRQYTERHPTVIALRGQLQSAQRQLAAQPEQTGAGTQTVPNPTYQALEQQVTQLESTASGAHAQVDTLESQRKVLRPRLDRLPDQARRIGDLERESKTAEAVFDALSRKYQEAIIARTTALSDVTITQAADPRNYSVSPNLSVNLALGIIVGLFLALMAALGADFLDSRFRTEDDVRDRLGLPVLATVPQIDSTDWRVNQWVKPLSVEAFYQLVAALRYSSDKPSRSIAFVSPEQGDGKSTVAVNTAISMGLMRARVLVIDADLRRPAVHEKLNVPNEHGLSDVLVGLKRFEEAVQGTHHANVWVLTAGKPAPNPVGLLQGEGFRRVLSKAAERFDAIIIDTPALRSIVDGAVLARQADGAVMVISAQRSDARSVQAALSKLFALGPVKLLGAVLNGAKPDARSIYNGQRNDAIAGELTGGPSR